TPTSPDMSVTLGFGEEAPPAPAPTPIVHLPTPQPRQSLVAKPNDFDGKDYKLFCRQCAIYMMANRESFLTSEEKVLFVLSYMKGGLASQWAENEYERIMEDGYVASSFQEFEARLQGTFSDPNKERNVQHQLSTTRQGFTETAEEFFQKFELNRRAAGYSTGHDSYLIELLERNLKRDIVNTIYTQDLPEDYEGWKRKAIRLDQQERRWRSMFPTTASPRFTPCQGNPTSTSTPPAPRPMALNQGQGTTFPGLGQPMDVDRRRAKTVCYNCQGKGHMARNCCNPRVPRQQVRQVEEVPAQGARIEEVKEMTKEEKEKKADELRAKWKALGF